MTRVAVAGKFDPPHDGHIVHICEAASLGDYLLVITHTDEVIKKVKGKCNIPLWARMELLNGILLLHHIKGNVVVSIDEDGTVIKTLAQYRPSVFAKGGDRRPDTMPKGELDVCRELSIRIVYGIGNELNRSSKMQVTE